MPRSLPLHRHVGIAARWPLGIALTSWRYMWRTTPLHRRECEGPASQHSAPSLPGGVSLDELQRPEDGAGALFHRSYRAVIREADLSATALMARLQSDLDLASPSEFATFRKTCGEKGRMRVGDEYVVRMAGPWDGPVRVIAVDDDRFRLATLEGHLEAGQIEFSAREADGLIEFRIESWARSANRLVHLLYTHLRMAKEVQFHMWTSFLERVVSIAGGRLTGGIDVETRRVEEAAGGA
jgi:hypothetical protein